MNGAWVGIDPGDQFSTEKIPWVVDTGSKVARLNLQIAANFHIPFETYRNIIHQYKENGVKVYLLVGAQSIPGGYSPDDPGGQEQFFAKFVNVVDRVTDEFSEELKDEAIGIELINEPNDFAGGTTHLFPPSFYARILSATYTRVKIEKGMDFVSLNSGGLLSHDESGGANVGDDSAANYLRSVYESGISEWNWEGIKEDTGSYPFDLLSYHIYVKQDSSDETEVKNAIWTNLAAIEQVLDEYGDLNKKIIVSEIGWGTGVGGVDEAGQAWNIKNANEALQVDPRVVVELIFTLIDFDERQLGVLYEDGTPKPSWHTFRQVNGVE